MAIIQYSQDQYLGSSEATLLDQVNVIATIVAHMIDLLVDADSMAPIYDSDGNEQDATSDIMTLCVRR